MSAFYKSQTLADALSDFQYREDANEMLRNVRVAPLYNLKRSLRFAAFSKETPETLKFTCPNGTVFSVYDYFLKTKKQKIQAKFPLAIVRPKQAGEFPSDQLFIVPYQKVRGERLSSRLAEDVHVVGFFCCYRSPTL